MRWGGLFLLIANTRKVLLVFSTAVNCCKYRIRHGQQQALKQAELTGNSGWVRSLNTKKDKFFRNFRNKSRSIFMLHKIGENKKCGPKLIFSNKVSWKNQCHFCDQCNYAFNLKCFLSNSIDMMKNLLENCHSRVVVCTIQYYKNMTQPVFP